MSILLYIAVAVSHICFVTMFLIIGDLSRILGVALKKKPVYKLMYLSSFLIGLGMVLNFLGGTYLFYSVLLDIAGISLASIVTYYYWNWLPSDLAKG